ncbi:MAG: caspase family protein [Planctomycetaceae bacterium]|nr:caspase family protein [Planctomycetaceae bacterium]
MTRLPLTALVTLGILALSLATTGWADDAPTKVALLVGVNKYLKPGFSDLEFAEADVVAMSAELQKLGFDVTTLLGSGKGAAQATKANIEAAARKMVVPLGKRDVALVMLSGHGQQLQPDPDADPNTVNFDKSQSFYCPVDARVNDPASQVSLSYLLDDILARDVGRKLLVVDACRDVPVDRTRGVRNARGIEGRVVALPEGTGVFFSCSAGQTSLERAELGHGLFTYCLLEGLRGGALHDGEIAWSDLFGFVNRRMSKPDIANFMPAAMRQVPCPTRCWGSWTCGRR